MHVCVLVRNPPSCKYDVHCEVLIRVCPHTQLPHLPHISEGLMKRNLRRGDMRDMSLGQLQVITNDFHAQIQSE